MLTERIVRASAARCPQICVYATNAFAPTAAAATARLISSRFEKKGVMGSERGVVLRAGCPAGRFPCRRRYECGSFTR